MKKLIILISCLFMSLEFYGQVVETVTNGSTGTYTGKSYEILESFQLTPGFQARRADEGPFFAKIKTLHFTPEVNTIASANTNIVITFNDIMDISNIDDNIIINGSTSGLISGTWVQSVRTLTFDPNSDFAAGETVTVSITDQLTGTYSRWNPQSIVRQFYIKLEPPIVYDSSIGISTSSKFFADWEPVNGATGYKLFISSDPSFENPLVNYNPLILNLNNTTHAWVDGLEPCGIYYYRVSAFNENVDSELSETHIGRTGPNQPNLLDPTDIIFETVGTIKDYSFTLNWEAVTCATSYEINISRDGGGALIYSSIVSENHVNITKMNIVDYSHIGISRCDGLKYSVIAINEQGESQRSLYQNLYFPQAGVEVYDNRLDGSLQANLQWTSAECNYESSTHFPTYLLYISQDINFSTHVVGYDGRVLYSSDGHSKNVYLPEGCITYYYRIKALNLSGLPGEYSNTGKIDEGSNIPVALDASNINATSFIANWSDEGCADVYRLEVSTVGNFSVNKKTYEVWDNFKDITINSCQERYYYRVSGSKLINNHVSYTSPSEVITVNMKLDIPIGLNQVWSHENAVSIEWEDVDCADYYQIKISENDPTLYTYDAFLTVPSSSITINNLNAGFDLQTCSSFYWTVQSYSSNISNSLFSEVQLANTSPPSPESLNLIQATETTLEVDWNDVSCGSGYHLTLLDGSGIVSSYNNIYVTESSYTFNNLEPCHNYQVRLNSSISAEIPGINYVWLNDIYTECSSSGRYSNLSVEEPEVIAEIEQISSNEIKIYPNPAKQYFTLELEDIEGARVEIYDLMGNLLYSKDELTESKTDISIKGYKEGIVFVRVIQNGYEEYIKLVIEK